MKKHDARFPYLSLGILNFGLNAVPIAKSQAKSARTRYRPLEGRGPRSRKSFGSYRDRVAAAFDYVYKKVDKIFVLSKSLSENPVFQLRLFEFDLYG
ncbi:hypothetical protein BYT27DRAFT_7193528 [Phlegmacium glaucopus]|nr:hypothetical protein BYT27DRAFT_7193528 [Phlegmacium glaucopus]